MNKKTKKLPKENLTWVNPHTGAQFHAGVAFYDEQFGEYRLVLDGPRTVFNLKPVESNNHEVKYKVYCPITINGKFSHKVEVGHGHSNQQTNGDILITIGRYGSMRLLLPKLERKVA
jgi:hypothetical protein